MNLCLIQFLSRKMKDMLKNLHKLDDKSEMFVNDDLEDYYWD